MPEVPLALALTPSRSFSLQCTHGGRVLTKNELTLLAPFFLTKRDSQVKCRNCPPGSELILKSLVYARQILSPSRVLPRLALPLGSLSQPLGAALKICTLLSRPEGMGGHIE